jgi:hypothetical protein
LFYFAGGNVFVGHNGVLLVKEAEDSLGWYRRPPGRAGG